MIKTGPSRRLANRENAVPVLSQGRRSELRVMGADGRAFVGELERNTGAFQLAMLGRFEVKRGADLLRK